MLAQIEMMCETTLDEAEIDVSDISDIFLERKYTDANSSRDC